MYKKEVEIRHTEALMAVDQETGELRELAQNKKVNSTFEYMDAMPPWSKSFSAPWLYLEKILTPIEYKVAHRLFLMSQRFTCSLMPYSDDMSMVKLGKYFNMSDKSIKKVLDKLFQEGVYGKWEVVNADYVHTKYWAFNPYLGYNGSGVHYMTKNLFSHTMIAKISRTDRSEYLN